MIHASSRRQLGLIALACLLAAATAWSAGQVTGKFVGNGKEAKLAHAVVIPHEPWDDTPAYTLILSEKDPAASKKPDFDAQFGKLGNALVIGVTQKGEIFSTQVCHQALKRAGFSTTGSFFVDNLKIEGKQLSGHFFTKKTEDFFDDHWSADLTVKAALP